jgi:predicted SnoaL-like aldol condensation-catalyzing enzyme
MLTSLMNAWVDRDPAAALQWAQSQTNSQLREDATAAAVGAWAKTDPSAALSYVQSIADVETRASAFKKAWGDWFKNDPDAATTYVASIKDEKLLENVSFQFGYNTEGLSPKEKAALLARLPEGKLKEDIYKKMTDTKIRKGQFNDALAMLNVLPDSRERDRNVAQLGQTWAKTDMAAATAWLKIQPDSTDRDLALTGYASTLARTDPIAAINWVKTIPDQKLRQGALMNIASSWSDVDPNKAAVWINGAAGFSASEKRMIQINTRLSKDYMFNIPTVGTRR